ncbi:circularly permutated Ras protein 1-like [Aplochiton taeniatus]
MGPLPGNPNIILVSLGKIIAEENVLMVEGTPTSCSQCGSILDSCYDNVVDICYFCQSWEPEPTPETKPRCPQNGCQDCLFLPNPKEKLLLPTDALLLFCIDISGSMRSTSKVVEGEEFIYKSRLKFVQEAVLQCVKKLSTTQPHTKVGLITFNNQVILHGYKDFPSRFLCGSELIDSEYLKEAALSFPSPPPLSWTRDCLEKEIKGLSEFGATALGPAALVAIAMASRQPGSKVIVCTDGKANTRLGNLEAEDKDAHTPISSTIFYQDLGEYAAKQGVTVSVLSIEETDCRLDELGRLADRTGGKVVIASPQNLHTEFGEFVENTTVVTHCSATLLLPKALRVRGEREAGHRAVRELGNVAADKEITLQFGAVEQSAAGRVSVQLQLRYRRRNGQAVIRVLTVDRDVTEDSSVVLSSLSLAAVALNSSQASAALAVRGRFLEARKEAESQRTLMERALEYNHSAEDNQAYIEWIKTMEPIHNNINSYTRRKSVISDLQSLTDRGAELLYGMKHGNRRSILLKHKS